MANGRWSKRTECEDLVIYHKKVAKFDVEIIETGRGFLVTTRIGDQPRSIQDEYLTIHSAKEIGQKWLDQKIAVHKRNFFERW